MSVTRSSWRTQPVPTAIEELPLGGDSVFEKLASSPAMIAMLRAGYVPEDDECIPFFFCEGNSILFHRSWDGVFMYRFEIGLEGESEKITHVWVNNEPSQFRRAVEPKREFLTLVVILDQARIETRIAARDSWRIQPMPDERERIPFSVTISRDDYEMLKRGEIPAQMEDHWFMYVEDDWLYVHRSWTGICLYQVRFDAVGSDIVAVEAWANRNPDLYEGHPGSGLSDTRALAAKEAELLDKVVRSLVERAHVKYYRKIALGLVRATNPVAS